MEVLVASKTGTHPKGLECHGLSKVFIDTTPGWAVAANALLDKSTEDVVFCDDDIEIMPQTFDLLDRYWNRAHVFGFCLMHPMNPDLVLSAGFSATGGASSALETMTAAYVAHVTASLMVVKRCVIEAGIRFPVWPGVHFEDMAFTYECWLKGFKVAYLPRVALHNMYVAEGIQIGATKVDEPDCDARRAQNRELLNKWCEDNRVMEAFQKGTIPLKRVPL